MCLFGHIVLHLLCYVDFQVTLYTSQKDNSFLASHSLPSEFSLKSKYCLDHLFDHARVERFSEKNFT